MEEMNALDKPIERQDPISRLLSCMQAADGSIYRTRCKICNSPNRRQVEDMFDSGATLVKIKEWLDAAGEPVAMSNLRNHIQEHYQSKERVAALVEYMDDIASMRDRRQDIAEDLKTTLEIGHKELARILSMQTGGNVQKEKIRNDMFNKTWVSIQAAYDKLRDMHDEDTRIKAIEEKFLRAWSVQIEAAKTEDEKKALLKALQQFKEYLEE